MPKIQQKNCTLYKTAYVQGKNIAKALNILRPSHLTFYFIKLQKPGSFLFVFVSMEIDGQVPGSQELNIAAAQPFGPANTWRREKTQILTKLSEIFS